MALIGRRITTAVVCFGRALGFFRPPTRGIGRRTPADCREADRGRSTEGHELGTKVLDVGIESELHGTRGRVGVGERSREEGQLRKLGRSTFRVNLPQTTSRE
jgi:hypothetical protein